MHFLPAFPGMGRNTSTHGARNITILSAIAAMTRSRNAARQSAASAGIVKKISFFATDPRRHDDPIARRANCGVSISATGQMRLRIEAGATAAKINGGRGRDAGPARVPAPGDRRRFRGRTRHCPIPPTGTAATSQSSNWSYYLHDRPFPRTSGRGFPKPLGLERRTSPHRAFLQRIVQPGRA